ncbi:MAG: short-chain dehydrogenase/reductase [Paenibacillaceae bacterium]|jgi:3-oxoacyl-[acyl-carrier protein] reductase|nr:short-chain dehydrogenase/reductase [Paenibacillaceae bacterium]
MGKSVLVTGAVSGTGLAIAKRFAAEHYDVFITSRTTEGLDEAAAEISREFGVFAKGYELDSPGEAAVKTVFEDIRRLGYMVDCVVLSAANLGIGQDFFEVALQDFMDVFATNLGWNFAIARQGALQMREKGGGSIVFISSNTVYRAIPNRAAYSASKSGITGLSRAMAVDLGKYGIRSNCVLPGMIKTERWQQSAELRKLPSNYTPIGDIADFGDIADAAWFLGSEQAKNITGAELIVDGGNTVQLYPIVPNNQ